MYSRVLSSALRHAPRASALRSISAHGSTRRRLCQGSRPKAAAAATPGATAAASAPAAANAAATADAAVAKPAAANTAIPNVNSTSLGLDYAELEDDPKKWQKFAWKYLGSIVVFLIAYKAVNWYADKLEEDGKRKRDEVEENKVFRKEFDEFDADQQKAHEMLLSAQSPGAAHTPAASRGGAQQPAALFKSVQEEEGFVSELDELRTLQVELETKLKAITRERKQTAEVGNRKLELEGELKDLEIEIMGLEKEEKKQAA